MHIKYSGTDNLEIMNEAINYNLFLRGFIKSNLQNSDRVLDIGAGIGTFAKELSLDGYMIDCIEPDLIQLGIIRSLGLRGFQALTEIEDLSIDSAYSINVLEHIEDDTEFLKEIWRKLKVGSPLIIYVPALQMLYSSMDLKVGHFRRYSRKHLIRALIQSGFVVENAKYVDSLGFFASLIYKIWGDKNGNINRSMLIMFDRFFFPMSLFLDKLTGYFFGKNLMVVARKTV